MADKPADEQRPPVRKIAEGVSGLPGSSKGTPRPVKADPDNPHFGSGSYWIRPSNYAKGGKVGKVNPFGMKNSKPDFAGGGPQTNRKFNFKKGDM